MKKIIIATIMAFALSIVSIAAQTQQTTYIIDGKVIENFNGSQLVGKKIKAYLIEKEKNIHQIFTEDFELPQTSGSVVRISTQGGEIKSEGINDDETVFVLDGKVISRKEMEAIEASKINSMSVIKHKDHEDFKKYANEGTAMVVLLSTRPSKNELDLIVGPEM